MHLYFKNVSVEEICIKRMVKLNERNNECYNWLSKYFLKNY